MSTPTAVYAFHFNDTTEGVTTIAPFAAADPTPVLYVTADVDLTTVTGLVLNIRGPASNFTLTLTVGTPAQDFGSGAVPAKFWATRAVTAADFPVKGKYELELIGTIAGKAVKSGIVDLVVNR